MGYVENFYFYRFFMYLQRKVHLLLPKDAFKKFLWLKAKILESNALFDLTMR